MGTHPFCTQPVRSVATVPEPTVDDVLCLSYDPVTNAVVYKIRRGGTVQQSFSANQASINALHVTASNLGDAPASAYRTGSQQPWVP